MQGRPQAAPVFVWRIPPLQGQVEDF